MEKESKKPNLLDGDSFLVYAFRRNFDKMLFLLSECLVFASEDKQKDFIYSHFTALRDFYIEFVNLLSNEKASK